ncbi:MAG: hypothetical protein FGM17_09140 [Polynucleobacter sp.]|uniref:hypothetical protein n=1 Tax=Polynucleobacter sp. TaxID=2029855 RepID=UPI00216FBF66|nr:hypothetical protein [Polynucleobacter sp.]MBU3670867.1 hypothetical protein [Polynucleobacter sp.]
MSDINMKRAVHMNGWCFAGDERTIQTSLEKLIEKGLEVQLTDAEGVLVCKLEISLIKSKDHPLSLSFKVNNLEGHSEVQDIRVEMDGEVLAPKDSRS